MGPVGCRDSQEEETLGGAFTSPFEIQPDLVIAVDVTFAKGPGSNDHRAFPLGKGPPLVWAQTFTPPLANLLKATAEEMDMPYAIEYMPISSGTDGMGIQVTAEGIPTEVIGIPIRYMHTPIEMTTLKDIQRAGRLACPPSLPGLNRTTMEKIFAESKE